MEGEELQNQKILYLFSSNQLPQYERDAIDAVCLPSGSIMQFRYGSINIDPSIKDLITQGKQATLIGQKVLVVFVNILLFLKRWTKRLYPFVVRNVFAFYVS